MAALSLVAWQGWEKMAPAPRQERRKKEINIAKETRHNAVHSLWCSCHCPFSSLVCPLVPLTFFISF